MTSIGTRTRLEGSVRRVRALPPPPHPRRPILHNGVGVHPGSVPAKEVVLPGAVGETSLLASVGLIDIHPLAAVAFALKNFCSFRFPSQSHDEFSRTFFGRQELILRTSIGGFIFVLPS